MKQLHYVDDPDGVESISINGVQLEGEENRFQVTSEQISGLPVSDLPRKVSFGVVEKNSKGEIMVETIQYSIVALNKLDRIRVDFMVEAWPKHWFGVIGLDRWVKALLAIVKRLGSVSFPGLAIGGSSYDDVYTIEFSITVNAKTTDEVLKTAEAIRKIILDAFDLIEHKIDALIVHEIKQIS